MLAALRRGAWITRQRIRVYAMIMLAVTVGSIAALLAGSDGLNDARGRPLGTDFSNVYAAGTYAVAGNAAAPFDPDRQYRREQQIFGTRTPFYGWHYPPLFLLVAAALATLPYLLALGVWQAATLVLYLRSQWQILPNRLALFAALAFPAVMVNLTHGHNGFLTAALLGVGLAWLPMRPVLAGVALGLLSYKPQFGLLIPLALLAGLHWRSLMSAGATVLLLCAAVTVLWGMQVWDAFRDSFDFTRIAVLEQGGTGFHKMTTVFAWVRLWGGSVDLAYAVQLAAQLCCAALVWTLWRSRQAHEIKAAGLILACMLATPYMLDYDLMILAPLLALWVKAGLRDGFAPYEKSALAVAWIMPLLARMAALHLQLPLAQLSLLVLFGLMVRRLAARR